MSNRKWYYGTRSAEGDAIFFLKLTNEEAEIIRRFISAQHDGPDIGYSGCFDLSKNNFNSKEEAIAYTITHYNYIWAYDKTQYDNKET